MQFVPRATASANAPPVGNAKSRKLRDFNPTEIMPLSQWIHETSCFNVCRSIRTFKNHIYRKLFDNWRSSIRHSRFCQTRAEISKRLFCVKPLFSPTLQDINCLLSKVCVGTMMDLTFRSLKTVTEISHFEAVQTAKFEGIVEQLRETGTQCRDLSEHIERLVYQTLENMRMRAGGGEQVGQQDIAAAKTTSILLQRQERERQAREVRDLEMDSQRLPAFLRLVDYMMVEALYVQTMLTHSTFLDLVSTPPAAPRGGTFRTALYLGEVEGAPIFEPSRDVFVNTLTGIMSRMLVTASSMPRVMLGEGHQPTRDVSSLVRKSARFIQANAALEEEMHLAYDVAEKYAQEFETFRGISEFCSAFDAENYLATDESRTVASVGKGLQEAQGWLHNIDRTMTAEKRVTNLLLVDTRPLKKQLTEHLPIPMNCMKRRLLEIAQTTCTELIDTYSDTIQLLAVRPNMPLSKYADLVENHDTVKKQQAPVAETYGVLQSAYVLLQQYEVKIPIMLKTQQDLVEEQQVLCDEAILGAKSCIDTTNEAYCVKLDESSSHLGQQCDDIISSLGAGHFVDPEASAEAVIEELLHVDETIVKLSEGAAANSRMGGLLRGLATEQKSVEKVRGLLDQKVELWRTFEEWERTKTGWEAADLRTLLNPELNKDGLDGEGYEKKVETYFSTARGLDRTMKDDPVVKKMLERVKTARRQTEIVMQLGHPSLQDRHWLGIYEVLGSPWPGAGGTVRLGALMELDVFNEKFLDDLDTLCGGAGKEYSMKKTNEKMQNEWTEIELGFGPYKETGTFMVTKVDEVQQLLDDQIVKAQTMKGSPFARPFMEDGEHMGGFKGIGTFETQLSFTQDLMDEWLAVQATYMYLEPIFSSPDIKQQLPQEGDRFKKVDKSWRATMTTALAAPLVLDIIQIEGIIDNLKSMNVLLDKIQKGLNAYLEQKRLYFPRFFFLSADELLEILAENSDPRRVQPHIKKSFEGVDKLTFDDDLNIMEIISPQSEVLTLNQSGEPPINPSGGKGVEIWLEELEQYMRRAVHDTHIAAMLDYEGDETGAKAGKKTREEWVADWPGQVVLVISQLHFCKEVEFHVERAGPQGLKELTQMCSDRIFNIVNLVRSKIPKLLQRTCGALIVIDVHAKECLEQISATMTSKNDFDWTQQLRYYYEDTENEWENNGLIVAKMLNSRLKLEGEYVGNSGRLVITPLTDRCYRTLIGACYLNLGGAPEGPAGTGKTETAKDLAKALAMMIIVFNCSDQMDYLAMGKFFKGLIGAGAWACFDEFNRINLEVLSVVAQQVLSYQLAKNVGKDRMIFEGTDIKIRMTCNAFITMNPGYAGRSDLPDNLKVLFRTVAMMVPDYGMIAKIILYSFGYMNGEILARKLVTTYALSSEQLSSQYHYDYGMRAVVAVLRAAGNLKKLYPPDFDENILMLRALKDVNEPKFLENDLVLFLGIIEDLFRGVVLPPPDYADITNALVENTIKRGLQPTDYFIKKCIEVWEMLLVRHGFMIVGEPFAGKTESYRVLAAALGDLAEKGLGGEHPLPTQYVVINPKSVAIRQLYGYFDPVSHEWTDGVVAVKFRDMANRRVGGATDRNWLVFDGPVDAIWIENMNTVLDDNKKLCLMSGEIIAMSDVMNIMFEPMDLEVASPATVSRCGMVFYEPHLVGWRPIYQSWLQCIPTCSSAVAADAAVDGVEANGKEGDETKTETKKKKPVTEDGESGWVGLTQELKDHVTTVLESVVDTLVRFMRRQLVEQIPTQDINVVTSALKFLEVLIKDYTAAGAVDPATGTVTMVQLDMFIAFALLWSVGGALDEASRPKFSAFMQQDDAMSALTVPTAADGMEGDVTFYDFTILAPKGKKDKETGVVAYDPAWILWEDTLSEFIIPLDAKFHQVVVPTKATILADYFCGKLMRHGVSTLFCGPTGTGKSVYCKDVMYRQLPQDEFAPLNVNFSAQTTAMQTQTQVDLKLDKWRKGKMNIPSLVYGPPGQKKMVLMIDDINMPMIEEYGAQPPIELIRQFMDHEGWYDHKDKHFRIMKDVTILAAQMPPGGGRNAITPRLLRHFNVISFIEFDDSTLRRIFNTFCDWYLQGAEHEEVKSLGSIIVEGTLDTYRKCIVEMKPTPAKSHYIFNLRDFSRVVAGIMLVDRTFYYKHIE